MALGYDYTHIFLLSNTLQIWNYNKNPEDSFRGAKQVSISLDDTQLASEPFVFRKATGIAEFDFGQLISFANYDKVELLLYQFSND